MVSLTGQAPQCKCGPIHIWHTFGSAFVERVNVVELEARDRLVSLDVTDLFTQVPVDEALKMLKERLLADNTLTERTSIPVPQLIELIEMCLRTTFSVPGHFL